MRIWSRETGSAVVPPRVSLLISILRLNLVLTYGIPPVFRGGAHYLFKSPYAIESVPSLSGHAIAYLWRSLPRVRRHRTTSINLKAVPNESAALAGHHGPIYLRRLFFPHPLLLVWSDYSILKAPAWYLHQEVVRSSCGLNWHNPGTSSTTSTTVLYCNSNTVLYCNSNTVLYYNSNTVLYYNSNGRYLFALLMISAT